MENAAKIWRLVLRDGRSIRSVSRSTGLSRNTIKKYLRDATPPRYRGNQSPVRHKLQGFEDRLRSLFEQDQKRVRRERRIAVKLPAIINLINQLVEPVIEPLSEAHLYPALLVAPKADCKRYEVLYAERRGVA